MKSAYIFILSLLAFGIFSCSPDRHISADLSAGDTITAESSLLTLVDMGDWTAAEVRVPWSDSLPLARYAIVHPDKEVSELSEGFIVIESPVNKSVVLSSVYTHAIAELGHLDAVRGVADGSYYPVNDTVAALISSNKICDIGSSMSPLIENVVDLEPDVILLSPYAGNNSTGLEKLNVPMVWMADYLEDSPLGRAEWILFIGELLGEREQAMRFYQNARQNYTEISRLTDEIEIKPTVIVEKPMSGVWYVPGGQSYIAKMIEDAGGKYPWDHNRDKGSISLDAAAVVDKGADADIWLIKDIKDITLESLLREVPQARALKPFDEKVYLCNTLSSPYYNVIAFRPDSVLADMAALFHPEIFPNHNFTFYKKIK